MAGSRAYFGHIGAFTRASVMQGSQMTERRTATIPETGAILRAPETCWRTAHIDRLAVIVDGASYFRALKEAILSARHSVLMIGWDFHTGIELERDAITIPDVPNTLGAFLSHVVRRNRSLQVHVLRWDLAFLKMPFRGTNPRTLLDWFRLRRIHFRLDSNHPLAACHHQKIVVIDDSLAFCGGIDTTIGRWDTHAHKDDDPRRIEPDGALHPPWHDATTALSGPAARALGDLARERWRRATGKRLAPPPPEPRAPWPTSLKPAFGDIEIGIARTWPATDDLPAIREIEQLYLAAIRAARHTIYLESQYFAAPRIAAALAERLAEPDGPEILIVNPKQAEGWLEAQAMGSARAMLIRDLRRADCRDRLRVATPVNATGGDIYVHAKVLIVDDRLLRIGSSNVNNRSMGVDTECDLAIEAPPDGTRPDISTAIVDTRDSLLSEHFGLDLIAWREALSQAGTLRHAFDQLTQSPDGRGESGRRLVPLQPEEVSTLQADLAASSLLDPDSPEAMDDNFLRALRLLNRPRPRKLIRRLT